MRIGIARIMQETSTFPTEPTDLGYEPCHRFTMDGVQLLRQWPVARTGG